MLVAVTVPILVPGFNFTSHLDLLTTTTSISELPGFNSEVFTWNEYSGTFRGTIPQAHEHTYDAL